MYYDGACEETGGRFVELIPRSLGLKNHLDAAIFFIAKCFVQVGSIRERAFVGDDERRINLARHNLFQQGPEVSLGVGLASFYRKSLIHERAERYFVEQADVNAGN
jgi:hypothetical protein